MQTSASDSWPRWLLLLALLAANAALALGPYFVRLADTGPISAGFWRLFLAIPFLALFARINGERLVGLPHAVVGVVLLAGVFFGLDLASWHVGIEMTRLGNATLFGNSGSLVLMVWGFIAWRRLPRGMEWLAIIAALAGAAILLAGSLEISRRSLAGDLFCLLAGLLYAGYLLILQGKRGALGSWGLLTWSAIGSMPVLLALAVLNGEPLWPTDWTPVLLLFVSSQLVGQGLLVFSLRHFPPLVIGLALLTQPAISTAIGWQAFGEVVSPLDIFGMLLLAAALALSRGTAARAPSTVQPPAAS